MTPESSPFRPGQPIPAEFFVGWRDAIERLSGLVRAANRGVFKVGFITGERGIGKSSLASFVRHLCEREGQVTGCHVYLGGVHDLHDMTRRTFDRLLKDSIDRPWHRHVVEFFGDRVRKVGLFGVSVELALSTGDLRTIADSFTRSVLQLTRNLEQRTSLLLVLDDINGLAGSADFAHWLKSLVDEVATSHEETRLCILLVGLEERRRELIHNQPSLARVSDLVDVAPWSDDEVEQFFGDSFASESAVLSAASLRYLVRYTGGLPVLAHEIGDAVWHTARALTIGQDEIVTGVVRAAEIIGRKLLEPQIFKRSRAIAIARSCARWRTSRHEWGSTGPSLRRVSHRKNGGYWTTFCVGCEDWARYRPIRKCTAATGFPTVSTPSTTGWSRN